MASLTPNWIRPSHPGVQDVVIIDGATFSSKSFSKVSLPPFGLYAKMTFPPCTHTGAATYATVQVAQNRHVSLNSDLMFINHSCEPSLIFDTASLNILAGPRGLREGEELTFFYPSTEWEMAQPFDCLCGKPSCRGRISGAKTMTRAQLEGVWLNPHIRSLLDAAADREDEVRTTESGGSFAGEDDDPTAQALRDALAQAEKVVDAARFALLSYVDGLHRGVQARDSGTALADRFPADPAAFSSQSRVGQTHGSSNGSLRRGPTSRELSGEMGGDTICA